MPNTNDTQYETVSNSQEIYEIWREDQLAEDDANVLKADKDSEEK
jgi:hypothetical protein